MCTLHQKHFCHEVKKKKRRKDCCKSVYSVVFAKCRFSSRRFSPFRIGAGRDQTGPRVLRRHTDVDSHVTTRDETHGSAPLRVDSIVRQPESSVAAPLNDRAADGSNEEPTASLPGTER